MDSGGLLIETGVRILSFVVLLSKELEQVHMLDGFWWIAYRNGRPDFEFSNPSFSIKGKESRSTGDSPLPSHHFE